ncbi:hypothetical protein [Rhizobium brockwellii]|uniref:hypothetical protein n=1 Tax=Rhizobium brockwellii TaxID=3019932 RepID=UPI00293DB2FF|nr:hypothetical protein [Rhizobium brockwellii]MDV4158446.1 hypothetical protein [Rhizobium brockwellii]
MGDEDAATSAKVAGRFDFVNSRSLYSIEGFSDSEKIDGIRLALVNLLESEWQERTADRTKPVAR